MLEYGRQIAKKHRLMEAKLKNMSYTKNYVLTVPNDLRGRKAIEEIKMKLGASHVSLKGRGSRKGIPKRRNYLGQDKNVSDLPIKLAKKIAVYKRVRNRPSRYR